MIGKLLYVCIWLSCHYSRKIWQRIMSVCMAITYHIPHDDVVPHHKHPCPVTYKVKIITSQLYLHFVLDHVTLICTTDSMGVDTRGALGAEAPPPPLYIGIAKIVGLGPNSV